MKITKSNYFKIIDKFNVKNLPADLQKGHEYVEEVTENDTDWSMYEEGGKVKDVIDNHFRFIEEFFENEARKAEKVKGGIKAKKDRGINETKSNSEKSAKLVRHLGEDVKFIKRFVGLHNKKKNLSAILTFIKALQKSIVQKLISKQSPFVKQIEYIQDELIRIYNALDKKKSKEGTVSIPDEVLGKLAGIAGGEAVYPSIGFIKRFIGMQGKEIEGSKRENFILQLERAVRSKKIVANDPFADRLKTIYEYLTKQYKSGKKVSIEKSELNGLECICNNCDKELGRIYDTHGKPLRRCKSGKYSDAGKGACSYNSGLGKVYDTKGKSLRKCRSGKYSDAGKGACSYNKGLAGVMTAEEVANMKFELLPFTGVYQNLFGKPEKNFSIMIHGEPGSGKSTFLMQFAKYLTRFGKVLYLTSEEYGSSTLTEKVNKYLNPLPPNFEFAGSIDSLHEKGKDIGDYDFVIFDSITDLGIDLESFKRIKEENSKTAFIVVLQNTKGGSFKGDKKWEHLVQIAAEIEDGIISVFKNRYGKKDSWDFFESEGRRMAA